MKNKYIAPAMDIRLFGTDEISAAGGNTAVAATSAGVTAAQDVATQMQILMRRTGGSATTVKMENIMGFRD